MSIEDRVYNLKFIKQPETITSIIINIINILLIINNYYILSFRVLRMKNI